MNEYKFPLKYQETFGGRHTCQETPTAMSVSNNENLFFEGNNKSDEATEG